MEGVQIRGRPRLVLGLGPQVIFGRGGRVASGGALPGGAKVVVFTPHPHPQIHNAPELALFCEGFFLKHMKALLEQDSFRQLIYGRNSKVQGLDPLQDLQTTLAERVHSVYITSRV